MFNLQNTNGSWSFASAPVATRRMNPVPISREKQLISVPDWLSARYLLRSLNDVMIEECYNKILQLFADKQAIIFMLIKSATPDQCKNIVEILKNTQLKLIQQEHQNNDNKSYFDYLPPESISNICEFLHRSDMAAVKMTSVSMALIIFNIMKCCKIFLFDMNELIEKNEYKFKSNFNIVNQIKTKRVQPFTKYKA
eukprot:166017_1